MVNTTAFVERLEELLSYYGLSASSFADRIGVQRSSISHLLSGRNKPSLEFVMRVVKTFPEVNLYWLLNGKGSFPQQQHQTTPSAPAQKKDKAKTIADPQIEKIIVFYKDGTFKTYKPGQG